MPNDLEIGRSVTARPIAEVAAVLGLGQAMQRIGESAYLALRNVIVGLR